MDTPTKVLDPQFEKLKQFDSERKKSNGAESAPTLSDAVKDLANKPVIEEKKPEIKATENKEGVKKDTENKAAEEKIVAPVEKIINLKKPEEKKEEVDPETKAHLDWLNEIEEEKIASLEAEKKETPNYEKEIESYKTRLQEQESILNDDYIKAVVEFRKNGGTDISELNKYLGITETKDLTIQDFYNQKGVAAGLKGDELKEAVEESIERYNTLPKLEQKEILNNFKQNLTKQSEEKIKSFSTQSQSYRQEQQKINNAAFEEIKKEVSEKVGKKYRGLLIDNKMGKEISELAPFYAPEIKDANGRVTGYDVKKGVRLAILDKFEKQLYKTQYDLAHVSAYEKAINERNRPSENMNGNEIVASDPADFKTVMKGIREEAKKKQGLFGK